MGTTWVARVLGLADRALLVHEPDNESRDPFALKAKLALGRYPVLSAGEQAPWEYGRLWELAFAGATQPRTPRSLATRLLLRKVTKRGELWHALCNHTDGSQTRKIRAVAALATPPAGGEATRRTMVKSVHCPLAIAWITKRIRVEVVIVLRHPFNTIASWMEMGWGGCGLDTNPLVRERFADEWDVPPLRAESPTLSRVAWEVGLFTSALWAETHKNSDWKVVLHENICTDPAAQFEQLYEDTGLAWTDEADRYVRTSNRPGTGFTTDRLAAEQPARWRKRLSADQLEEIRRVLSPFPLPPWRELLGSEP